ncbi:MAG: LytTR family transcriptional regulator DNA-binding domain-containing protein [Ruminococcus sp.]|nr:LytTR family transcriptional regulator DNA-binding domain-containing protein [Ruminococcus sp.]
MRLKILRDNKISEPCVTIEYNEETKEITELIEMVRLFGNTIQADINGSSFVLQLKDIYYFESVDDNSYIYTKNQVYSTQSKLYKIEEKVQNMSFVRVSKSCILNITKLKSVKPYLNGRFEATMLNDERLIINRHYVADFKRKFGI